MLIFFKENLLNVDFGVPKKGPSFSGPLQGYLRLKGTEDRGTVLYILMDLDWLNKDWNLQERLIIDGAV